VVFNGYSTAEAARIGVREVADHLRQSDRIQKAMLVCFGAEVLRAYKDAEAALADKL
jgi:O-acetyl-ADP-ribose deacetylase (regulator of RNase III)